MEGIWPWAGHRVGVGIRFFFVDECYEAKRAIEVASGEPPGQCEHCCNTAGVIVCTRCADHRVVVRPNDDDLFLGRCPGFQPPSCGRCSRLLRTLEVSPYIQPLQIQLQYSLPLRTVRAVDSARSVRQSRRRGRRRRGGARNSATSTRRLPVAVRRESYGRACSSRAATPLQKPNTAGNDATRR